ncbi:probable E3 ubiquitin-protein ligase RHG1A isoform X1 [Olea europaea var. sylvestris]|uniref:probable E3 ubiquitin-protein ligase RHG1A isoform X1 n=1 Tax=Olea europaea var. sylvestris TaxID=158386 RepID=UPI000C1CD13A|nr:probable E3 ubiquitin-protein ligase RHG1A isoform X1 [Olea europaea var. sylvestris]XP_022876137.1 probable E3 ubiquitin-protein ligase RHG1A isoform X1 [Olea europaea var. sylvestris]XP_022876138.1 probable E3 ubiquitin-protein ligase RHG1A isoform X1 [Olea europaea var. sylvestris]XP_022876139.1 probable E3 ubiquitin-protein ligase RHG1A isoform X1 [Olea europaea var. sylvestris]
MQGQRSAFSTLAENLSSDHGSTSSDAGINELMSWNNTQTTAQNQLSDYMMSSDADVTLLGHASHEEQTLSVWNVGETSSSCAQNQTEQNERKTEDGWPSFMSFHSGAAHTLDERHHESSDILLLDNVDVNSNNNQTTNGPFLLQNFSSDICKRDLNMGSGSDHENDDCQVVERPNTFKSNGSSNGQMPFASSSPDPFGMPSGSGGYLMEESEGRPSCSLDGRRLSCKRKAFEGNVGQSSGTGSSMYFQQVERSLWHAVPATQGAMSSISMSTPIDDIPAIDEVSEQANSRLGPCVGRSASTSPLTLNASGTEESSLQNFCLQMNGSNQQDSIPGNLFSTESNVGNTSFPSSLHSSRLRLRNHVFDSMAASTEENEGFHVTSGLHIPPVRRSRQSRWNEASSSRASSSSPSAIAADRDVVLYEETPTRSLPRNISEHHVFASASEMRNSSQNPPIMRTTGGNINVARNVASSSRAGSTSGVNSSTPNWSYRSSSLYPRRLSEIVQRSLLTSAGTESGSQTSNLALLRSAASQAMAISSASDDHEHHLPNSRSAMLERHLDGAFGVPYSLQILAASSEGRNSRLVSEQIRNVLDLMRRGEGLRFEDVMILDQPVLFGMADIHDRHRDMRLDVDNMSYEELLALEEHIGNVCTGLSEDTIVSCLKQRKYVDVKIEGQTETEPCCICQEEYKDGEDLGTLECKHDFHAECIKQWLMHKNLCPICKVTGLST